MQQMLLGINGKAFNATIGQYSNTELSITFPWSPAPQWTELKNEIKSMEGARFRDEGGRKFWTVIDNARNAFALDFLKVGGKSPFEKWHHAYELIDVPRKDKLRDYQVAIASEIVTKKQMLLAAEMGTGKTLIAITVLDILKPKNCWYVAPAFALHDIQKQFLPSGWNCSIWPTFMSYNEMVKRLKEWEQGSIAPDALILDESPAVKNPESIRSKFALGLANGMRHDHTDPLILLMSGAPAPKDPGDFWHQLEVIRPGFLREPNLFKFRDRMALIKKEVGTGGGSYPRLITWWDNEQKCRVCGQLPDHDDHKNAMGVHFHRHEPSINEVEKLYKRMQGIVRVVFKKDILKELPDLIYREVECVADKATQRRLQLIIRGASTTIEALTLSRELSDGIRYETIESPDKYEVCSRCNGSKVMIEYEGEETIGLPCTNCNATGYQHMQVRNTIYMPTPKDAALKELLEENDEYGRLVIYAGFTASIDRILALCRKEEWHTIRADGKTSHLPNKCEASFACKEHPLDIFQSDDPRKIVFVAHPKTAKAGITLTKSSMIVFYSNTFDGDDRIQAEARIHRIGMDINRGATIVDLIHLETDRYVLDNLRKKRQLQSITLGQLRREIRNESVD